MATPRRCAGCGAALGVPTDDDLTIVCRFCGLRHDINDLAAAGTVPQVVVVGSRARGPVTSLIYAVLAVVALVTAGSLYVGYRAASGVSTLVRESTVTLPRRATTTPRTPVVALADLPGLTEFAWRAVDAPPPPEGYAVFAPVAAIPWAMTIGRAWASDAVMTRIDVGRVSSNGVVDLSGEQTSGYRFVSPGRIARWKRETDAGSRSVTKTSLMLEIRGETVRVIVDDSDRDVREVPPTMSLPVNEILSRARKTPRFPDRPFYGGYMIHLPREGWVWYFSAPSGDSFPRVRARDGRVYPY